MHGSLTNCKGTYGICLLLQQPQLGIGSNPQGVLLKRETQPYDSPQVQLQEQPKESIIWTMETTKEKTEHKVNHFNVTTIDKYKKEFKLKIPLVIDFIIQINLIIGCERKLCHP